MPVTIYPFTNKDTTLPSLRPTLPPLRCPYTSNMYVRRVRAGEFIVVNPHLLQDLVARGLWTADVKNHLMVPPSLSLVLSFTSPLSLAITLVCQKPSHGTLSREQ